MEEEEFFCMECGKFKDIEEKGKATLDDKPYDACKECCSDEQKRQYYGSM